MTTSNEMIVLDQPHQIRMFNLLQLKYALHLEIIGMRHSRGSVYALVKRRFGFRGNKQAVYTQLCEHIERVKGEPS